MHDSSSTRATLVDKRSLIELLRAGLANGDLLREVAIKAADEIERLGSEVRLPDDVELLKRASQVPYLLENYRSLSDKIDDVACELERLNDDE